MGDKRLYKSSENSMFLRCMRNRRIFGIGLYVGVWHGRSLTCFGGESGYISLRQLLFRKDSQNLRIQICIR